MNLSVSGASYARNGESVLLCPSRRRLSCLNFVRLCVCFRLGCLGEEGLAWQC